MKTVLILLSMVLGLVSSKASDKVSTQRVNTKPITDTIRLKKLPALGDILSDSIRLTSNQAQLVTGSGISSSTTIENKGIIFDIAWDKDSRVNYVVTVDSNFMTKEHVRVNMTLKNIKDIQQVDIFKMPGWGYYIKLKSGWFAGFCIGKTCTDRELKDDDRVTSIFKR